MSKRLSKHIVSVDYFENSLTVSRATSGSISIASFATVIGAPVAILSTSFSLAFSISSGIMEKILETTQNEKKKNIIKLLCWLEVN